WLTVGVAIGRVEVQVVATVGLVGAMGVHRHLMGVVVGRGLLPGTAPGRRAGRVGGAGNRPAAGLVHPHRRTADEAVRAVVEVVGVEVIDGNAVATGTDEVVGVGVLVEERLDRAHVLVGEVTPDHAFVL